jgi:hypothetical protein
MSQVGNNIQVRCVKKIKRMVWANFGLVEVFILENLKIIKLKKGICIHYKKMALIIS